MTSLKIFLKVLNKVGYPNSSTQNIAKYVSYDITTFLSDMESEVGLSATNYFVDEAILKLIGPDKTFKLDLSNLGFQDSYVVIKITNLSKYDPEEYVNSIMAEWEYVDSEVYDENGDRHTIEGFKDTIDFGEMNEFYDFQMAIRNEAEDYFNNNLGFSVIF